MVSYSKSSPVLPPWWRCSIESLAECNPRSPLDPSHRAAQSRSHPCTGTQSRRGQFVVKGPQIQYLCSHHHMESQSSSCDRRNLHVLGYCGRSVDSEGSSSHRALLCCGL